MEERIAAAEAEVRNPMATKANGVYYIDLRFFLRIPIAVIFRGDFWQSICFECSQCRVVAGWGQSMIAVRSDRILDSNERSRSYSIRL